jgi:alpha-galactosidase
MSRSSTVARLEQCGRLEVVRLGVRYSEAAVPERSDEGVIGPLSFAEGPLMPGVQHLGPFQLTVSLDAAGDVASYDLLVRNLAEGPLHLESVVLGFRWTEIETGALRFLRHGWQSWSFTGGRALDEAGEAEFPSGPWLRGIHHGVGSPPPDRAGWHESDLVSVVGGSSPAAACLAGVLERGVGTGLVYLKPEARGVRVEVEVRFEVPVDSGELRAVERVRVALGREPNRLLEEFADELGAAAGARTGSPFQTGWCSWYHFFHGVTEEDLLRNLEGLAASRDELPIDVVQLDDGYQRAIGDWLEPNPRFPRGIAPLAAAIRDAGFRPGIWTAPFCVTAESRVHQDHADWLLRSGPDLHRGLLHPEWSKQGWVYVLDTSREEVCAHLSRTFAALVGMGFTYLKLDFLYAVAMQAGAHDPRLTRAERLRRGLDAVRAGAGPDAFLLGCGCPLGAAVGAVDGMRIGPDVAPAWAPDEGGAIPGLEPTGPATRNAVRNVLSRAWMHRRLWLNDPDCLMARTRETSLTPSEITTLAASIAATGGMVIFSDEVALLSPSERALIRDTVALAREVDSGGARGTARAIELLGDEFAAGVAGHSPSGAIAARVNASEESREVELDLAAVGLPPTGLPPATLLGTPEPRSGGEAGRPRFDLGAHQSALLRVHRNPLLAVFCDYDGTFAVQDVGATLARRYAGERRDALWERLRKGEFNPWSYNMELLDGLALSEEKLDAFLRTVEPDPGAHRLVAWCEENAVPFRVLSDGFDRNLDRLQELHGVRFAYEANRLWYENGAWRIAPGHPDPNCRCGTGTCKRARIREFRSVHRAAVVVHIGNGRVSDLCACQVADVVFAKDSLAEELRSQGVAFESFETLNDVVEGLERLLAKRVVDPTGDDR